MGAVVSPTDSFAALLIGNFRLRTFSEMDGGLFEPCSVISWRNSFLVPYDVLPDGVPFCSLELGLNVQGVRGKFEEW